MMMAKDDLRHHPYLATAANLSLLVVCGMVVRLAFYVENSSSFGQLAWADVAGIVSGGLRFDFAAIAYLNALWVLLLFLPVPQKEGRVWQGMLHALFVVTNAVGLASNLADAVYYPFIKRRTMASVFREFRGDDLTGIVGVELVNHWYLTLLFLVLTVLLWRAYITPRVRQQPRRSYYVTMCFGLLASALAVVAGMRGGLDPEQRPLHNGMARQYVSVPAAAVLVQNTPFSILRTLSKHSYPHYDFFASDTELDDVFSPRRSIVADSLRPARHDNVVIIMLESFASEYSARLNKSCSGTGCMPFLDSLMSEALTFEVMEANGISSIDAQASVLASMPMMVESIMSGQAAMNAFDGIGTYLKSLGYETAYFHGADNGSLSIDGFVRACGFDAYYGRREYANDADWDHHWGIWDEPFMQYFARTMTTMREPFCATLFTLTSHHPFQIPPAYRDTFPEGSLPIYKSIRYTDHALRRFFATARQHSWFDHTLFVITGDHTNLQECEAYRNDFGRMCVPVVFYHPTDTRYRGCRKGVAQQTDILPTLLHHVGYSGDIMAFGNDLLSTPPDSTEAVNYINGIYQLTRGGHLLQFDGERTIGFYDIMSDPQLKANLVGDADRAGLCHSLERRLKAIVQQYTSRMSANRISLRTDSLSSNAPQQ